MQTSPYEFYNNNYGVRLGYLINDVDKRHQESVALFSYGAYEKRALRSKGFKLRAGGGYGNDVLVNYVKLKPYEQELLREKFGEPSKVTKLYQFVDYIAVDKGALEFYSGFRLSNRRGLPADVVQEYTCNAEILNACHTISSNHAARRKVMGGASVSVWAKLAECVAKLDKSIYPHTLPNNARRLADKYRAYKKEGYTALIHKGFCNDNGRKVTLDIERFMLSLYIQSNNPYVADVVNDYWRFMAGDVDVVDYKTGEVYKRDDFYRDGEAITLSAGTFWNYINQPANRAVVDKYRMDTLTYQSVHVPHHHRHAPNYSLSKISMDDRDLPRKMANGKRVKAYYAYDVTSGCVIGAAYSQNKTTELFIDCMRNMFHFLEHNRFGMPMQVEVEHHLVNAFRDDLMKAGVVFPFVRWANPGNSQEKWAETGNRVKKYGFEKRYQDGIGRFYARLEANRTKSEKVFDAENDNYKEKTFAYEVLVADDMEIVSQYNNALHPNQKKYKGLTRLEVLAMYANPQMAQIDKPLLIRYIGDSTKTTIRRNQYVQVQYAKYALPNPAVLAQLQANNYEVTAYYLRNELDEIAQVYLYQNDVFLCTCDKIEPYNTANAEWDSADQDRYTQQAKYVEQFNYQVKQGKADLGRVKLISTDKIERTDVQAEVVEHTPIQPNFDFDQDQEHDDFNRHHAINSL